MATWNHSSVEQTTVNRSSVEFPGMMNQGLSSNIRMTGFGSGVSLVRERLLPERIMPTVKFDG